MNAKAVSLLVGVRRVGPQGSPGDLWWADLSDPDSARIHDYLTSEADLQGIQVSPDGTLAAYSSDESGIPEVYLRSFPEPGQQLRVSERGGQGPRWSSDGATLYDIELGKVCTSLVCLALGARESATPQRPQP